MKLIWGYWLLGALILSFAGEATDVPAVLDNARDKVAR